MSETWRKVGEDGWPTDAQFKAIEPTEADLERWEQVARAAAPNLLPGEWNWPMMVRSLVAEVRALRARVKHLEANATEDCERRSAEEAPHGP